MRKFLTPVLIIVYLLAVFYLLLPTPKISGLPNSFQSIEPGDTVEIPGVSAYYTDILRDDVLNYYKKQIKTTPFLNLPLPFVLLNHPIQYGRLGGYFSDQLKTTYIQEYVHPLRGQLLINGFGAKDSFALKAIQTPATFDYFFINNQKWESKVTIKYVDSNPIVRVVIFSLTFAGFIFVYKLFKRIKNET
ncbi:MAG TPA: hypothetical protein VIK81_04455 [Patescibacteria group bacterium]